MNLHKIKSLAAPVLLGGAGVCAGHFEAASFPAHALAPAASKTGQPLVALAARQIGIRRCLGAISVIGQRGTTGATMQDILVNWNHQAPDSAPFFSLTGMGAGTQRATLSITAVPAPTGSCAVMAERVSSGSGSCAAVAEHDLPPFPGRQLIDGITVYQNPKNPEETYTLIQNPGSCIVIRRQAMFQWSSRP